MGSGQSTRRVTVLNDSDGFIKLSESVVERLKDGVEKERGSTSQQSSGSMPQEPPSPPPTGHHYGHQESGHSFVEPSVYQEGTSERYVTMDTLRLRQKHQEELDMVQRHHRSKIEQLETQNRLLFDAARAKLENKLNEVEEKFISTHRHEPVCVEAERNVEFCYNDNRGMPLKCSKVAKDFINCVDSVRRQVINEAS